MNKSEIKDDMNNPKTNDGIEKMDDDIQQLAAQGIALLISCAQLARERGIPQVRALRTYLDDETDYVRILTLRF